MKKIISVALLTVIAGYLYAQNVQEENTIEKEYVEIEQEDSIQPYDNTDQDGYTNQNQSIISNEDLEKNPSDDYLKSQPLDYDDCINRCKEYKKNDIRNSDLKTKSSWYIGFGLGSGRGAIEGDSFNKIFDSFADSPYVYSCSKSTPVTLNFGVGAIINPKLHVGLDISAIYQTAEYYISGGEKAEIEFLVTNMLGAITYYPNETGFSLKGGLGISNSDFSTSGGPSIMNSSEQYSGYAFLIGVGYDFWLGKTFNLGLHVEYSRQNYNDSWAPKNSDFVNVYLSFYWL